jgi:hypothetical protein
VTDLKPEITCYTVDCKGPQCSTHMRVISRLRNVCVLCPDYDYICTIWVSRMLTDKLEQKRTGFSLSFLERYHKEYDEFSDHVVLDDEN